MSKCAGWGLWFLTIICIFYLWQLELNHSLGNLEAKTVSCSEDGYPNLSTSLTSISIIYKTLQWLWNILLHSRQASQVVLVVKNLPANTGDIRDEGSTPGLGRSPGRGHGNTLQYSCLGNPMDRGAWQATVYRVSKSQTQMKQLSTAQMCNMQYTPLWAQFGMKLCEIGHFLNV